MNPIERFWQYLKGHGMAGYFTGDGDEVSDKLCQSIQELLDQPELIRSVCAFPNLWPHELLAKGLGNPSREEFRKHLDLVLLEAIAKDQVKRQEKWTESMAVVVVRPRRTILSRHYGRDNQHVSSSHILNLS